MWNLVHPCQLSRGSCAHIRRHRHARSCRRHAHVSLHLLVQRRAEISAVEGEDSNHCRNPLECARLTRGYYHPGRGCAHHTEAMHDVPVLLDVRDMEVHSVPELHALETVGSEMTADRNHVDVNSLSLAADATRCFGTCDVRVLVVSQLVELHAVVSNQLCRYCLCVVRLA